MKLFYLVTIDNSGKCKTNEENINGYIFSNYTIKRIKLLLMKLIIK